MSDARVWIRGGFSPVDSRRESGLLQEAADRIAAAGIERPEFEAQLLLACAAGVTRLDVLRGMPAPLTRRQAQRFEQLVTRRCKHEPLAYIRGTQEFYGLDFLVAPDVLIPRPETELLVETARREARSKAGAVCMDVGTGSGCIAIALARSEPDIRVVATDLSRGALEIAAMNAARHAVRDRVALIHSDLLEGIASASADCILSNPPYVASAEMESLSPEIAQYEPRMALTDERDGFSIHRRLAAEAPRVLRPGGLLAMEVGMDQASTVADLMNDVGFTEIGIARDLAGIERVVTGRKRKAEGAERTHAAE